MISIDLVLRIAIAFLRDMDLEEFQQLVCETSYLLTDINDFESEKIPRDGIARSESSSEFVILSPRYEAEILLCYVLALSRAQLHSQSRRELSEHDKQRYFKLLAMRKNGTPIEYILGRASFYSLDLYVDNCVLIPRPETELLVDKAIELIQKENLKDFIEVGTGSGAISLAILNSLSNLNAIATDISPAALNIARHNAMELQLDSRCSFVEANLLESSQLECLPKLLLSNPPYISRSYPLGVEVLCEPHLALFGGDVGDEILRRLVCQARQRGIKFLICEMGYDQRPSMEDILLRCGYEVEFYKDYAGLDRGFVATLQA